MGMAATFETLERGTAVLYGASGGIWVMTLHAKLPSAADMRLAGPALETMRNRHPDGFPTLTWVLPEAGLSMDSDARHAAAAVTHAFRAAILAMATLIEGQGFGAAAVRAIVSGIDLMSGAKAPKKVFGDLASSVAWCATLRPERDANAGIVDEIVASLASMRAGLLTAP